MGKSGLALRFSTRLLCAARLLCTAGLLCAAGLIGCSNTPDNGDGPPPPVENPSGVQPANGGSQSAPAQVSHATLRGVEKRAEAALGGAAGPGAVPDFAALAVAAAELEAGVEMVRSDRPGSAGLNYDGLADELAEQAGALRLAAEQQEAFPARRAFHQLTASCVRCHVGSGAP